MDTTPPTVACIDDLQQLIELGETGTVVVWSEPTATDISGVATVVSRSHMPGQMFTVGITTVTYIFADDAGNTAICTFNVDIVPGKVCFYYVTVECIKQKI